jgi:hypothetical protein
VRKEEGREMGEEREEVGGGGRGAGGVAAGITCFRHIWLTIPVYLFRRHLTSHCLFEWVTSSRVSGEKSTSASSLPESACLGPRPGG